MAYEHTEVPIAKSQESIRQIVYRHKGTGVLAIAKALRKKQEKES